MGVVGHIVRRLAKTKRWLMPNRATPVEAIVRSIPEVVWKDVIARYVVDMEVIRPAGVEYYQFNKELSPAFRTEMHFARRHIYRLRNVLVHPISGACRTADHYFQESYGSLRKCFVSPPFPLLKARSTWERAPAMVVHSTGYGHFLLEEVPRLLWVMERFPETMVYLADGAPRFCYEILDLVAERGIIHGYATLKADVMVNMAEYVFAQAEAYSGFFHSGDIRKLREKLMPPCEFRAEPCERLYIARRQSTRTFDNEQELEDILVAAGFRSVSLENMGFVDELALLQKASVVVAPHGAGLANIVWCHPGTKIVEIFSHKLRNDCYARLSSTLNLQYTPIWATATAGWGEVDLTNLEEAIANT